MPLSKKIKIALTGGIGTGKTYISKHFLDIGIPIFYADEEVKKMYDSAKIIAIFKDKFGDSFITNSKIDLSKLASFIFENSENRKEIEAIIHPLVMHQFEDWTTHQESNVVMLESALVFEAGLEKFFDKIIVVDAPLDVRIQRIKDRNLHLSEQEILQRIFLQIPQEEKCKNADFVILNI
ncbi:MAG: dephospho-CoA kinase [Bacteroidales bacterium]|jgi:dephospho-CoA kinase|nr:dephospho-CoA kinase [Bacteroidales bacterium]